MVDECNILIVYGTETGQSETISQQIDDLAPSHGITSKCFCLSQINKSFDLLKESVIVFVVSTTGDGDIPDKASKFWRSIKKRTLKTDHLKHLQYTLLALGDTNYSNFCNSGKKIDRRLKELGARKFYPTGYADDGVGLELVVEPWIDGLWRSLKSVFDESNNNDVEMEKQSFSATNGEMGPNAHNDNGDDERSSLTQSGNNLSSIDLNVPSLAKHYLKLHECEEENCHNESFTPMNLPSASSDLFFAEFKGGRFLTQADGVKTAIEATFHIGDSKVEYEPGDSFGLLCPNDHDEVSDLLVRLGRKNNEMCRVTSILEKKPVPKHLPSAFKLLDLFETRLEIRAIPKKAFLRSLAEYTADEKEKRRLLELCSRQGSDHYRKFVRESNVCLVDILSAFESCEPPVECIIEHLPRLLPRFYSVVNSPLRSANVVKFVFNVVHFAQGNGRCQHRRGVCTGYLENMTKNSDSYELLSVFRRLSLSPSTLPMYLRSNNHFRLPKSADASIIMIGPGTGVAPFISFFDHCHRLSSKGDKLYNMWLFYGCRHEDKDFLYKDEITMYRNAGIIDKLSLSFSRDADCVAKYVQDGVKMHKHDFVTWLDRPDCYLYVCGDASGMMKDVYECIVDVIVDVKQLSRISAEEFVKSLQSEKRYLQDVWR